jgi:ISXO2-like transposase domain
MKPDFAAHSVINHSKGEYVRREADFKVTTNTVESFFSVLKRSVNGVHRSVRGKYSGSYLTHDQWTDKAIKAVRGRRAMLNAPKRAEAV